MALPKDDWTLRWADGRPFDAESEAKQFLFGVRGQARHLLPRLANFMEYGERVEAIGAALPAGSNLRWFLVATDRALLLFANPVYGNQIIDDIRMPYAAITSCRLKVGRLFPLLFLKYGNLHVGTGEKSVFLRSIPRKQAEALRVTFAARLPAGVLTS